MFVFLIMVYFVVFRGGVDSVGLKGFLRYNKGIDFLESNL